MFSTKSISQIETEDAKVYAFRLTGRITDDEVESMSEYMNHAFDKAGDEKVDMVMIFEGYEGTDLDAMFDAEVIKSRWRSLTSVDKYVVVGAPDAAKTMIGLMDKIIPVNAKAFDMVNIHDAWAFVGTLPKTGTLSGNAA